MLALVTRSGRTYYMYGENKADYETWMIALEAVRMHVRMYLSYDVTLDWRQHPVLHI